jgi:histidinol-phosphatase
VNDDLAFAIELADLADRVTLEHFRSPGLAVEAKADLTPVTVADRETEQVLRDAIARERPGDAVFGEEYGSGGNGSARWILDPIDATRNYVRGIPVYATLIALQREGEVVVGVVSAPALGSRWWATRGEGAFADGRAISVSRIDRLDEATFSHGSARSFDELGIGARFLDLSRRAGVERGFGDFWQHMLVAEGRIEFAIDPQVEIWDLAAVQVIVEEAGGRFTDLSGAPRIDGGSGVSSNGLLHGEVVAGLGHDRDQP